jgi:hypothetical protein
MGGDLKAGGLADTANVKTDDLAAIGDQGQRRIMAGCDQRAAEDEDRRAGVYDDAERLGGVAAQLGADGGYLRTVAATIIEAVHVEVPWPDTECGSVFGLSFVER